MKAAIYTSLATVALLLCFGCTRASSVSYKDGVKKALEQAELTDVSVAEDGANNTVTLGGTVHSDDAKAKASEVAKAVAGERTVVNQIGVLPVGAESDAKSIASNVDGGIEKNYKAALISGGLDKQHVDFAAKNGVLTLQGSVKTVAQRREAEKLAGNIPNVQQVLNELKVKR